MKHIRTSLSLASLLSLLCLSSCQHYYLARTVKPENTISHVDSFQRFGKYFVFHGQGEPMHMQNLSAVENQNAFRFVADTLSGNHKLHVTRGSHGKLHYRKYDSTEIGVLKEVHIYASSIKPNAGETLTLPFEQIQKIEVLEVDRNRTNNSKTWGTIGFIMGGLGVLVAVSAAAFANALEDAFGGIR